VCRLQNGGPCSPCPFPPPSSSQIFRTEELQENCWGCCWPGSWRSTGREDIATLAKTGLQAGCGGCGLPLTHCRMGSDLLWDPQPLLDPSGSAVCCARPVAGCPTASPGMSPIPAEGCSPPDLLRDVPQPALGCPQPAEGSPQLAAGCPPPRSSAGCPSASPGMSP